MFIFPVQLTTSRIGNLTRLIHTLLYVMTIHTYIHTTLCQTAPVKSVKFQSLQRGVHSREMQYVEQSGVVVFEKCDVRIWEGVYLEIATFLFYFFRFFTSYL